MIKKIEKKFSNMAVVAMLLAIAVVMVIFKSFYVVTVVPSGSMLPTLSIGEICFTEKIRDEKDFQRGDILVFYKDDEILFIKRLIGMPGDTIEIKDGVLYLNSEAQTEEYINDDGYPMSDYGPYVVPDGHYFMMGDNRNNSADSRVFGAVAYEDLLSRVIFHFPSILKSLID